MLNLSNDELETILEWFDVETVEYTDDVGEVQQDIRFKLNASAQKVLNDKRQIDLLAKENDVMMDEIKYAVKLAALATGNNTIDDDDCTITYIKESVRKKVDEKRMKLEGIYEDYLIETNVKDSVRVKFK